MINNKYGNIYLKKINDKKICYEKIDQMDFKF